MSKLMRGGLAALAIVAGASTALAQSPEVPLQGRTRDPNLPPLNQTIPEKVRPGDATSNADKSDTTGSTLSDRLQQSDGVIKPPATGAPDMAVKPPEPTPNSTPVIKPGQLPGQGPGTEAK
ncbi:hypothetical protein VQ02_28420 [Methylobacterium variabile]|jgi:hypothetical protein|uniref:Uncharacterized protein n=1 Tax=Methylobacterium variabile TaxID=298794 RepID=A0A0J6S4R4_9HYPH|nr:hypothetical protein [Methylobacterium variabile]KMO30190.1 hypothetical protein VQ02_28420 [Methylobacterium variabile]